LLYGIHLLMEFTGKKSFLRTGSAVALIGLVLNIAGLQCLPDKHLSVTYSSEIFLANAMGLVGVGLILIGFTVALVGMLRVD